MIIEGRSKCATRLRSSINASVRQFVIKCFLLSTFIFSSLLISAAVAEGYNEMVWISVDKEEAISGELITWTITTNDAMAICHLA